MAKISILLAIYNGADSIINSIGCLQKQTLKDIEIVCVDDNSTDDSKNIIKNLQKEDNRIKLISFNENMGTVCARKAGVENASGEFIMFMDQDDIFEEYTCEELYAMIVDKKVDILHFRSKVIAVPPTTEDQRRWQEDFMKPYDGFLYAKDVFDFCFAPNFRDNITWNHYTWNTWNKIYKADVCKKAMKACSEDYVVNGDDIYVYMLIAYYANSYYGDANGKFYHIYSLGSGLMGNHKLSLKRFYTLVRRATGFDNEVSFFKEQNIDNYEEIINLDRCRALCGIVQRWYLRLEAKEQGNGYDMMCDYISKPALIASFEKHLKVNDANLFDTAKNANQLKITHVYVKNICVYINGNGNVNRSVNMDLIKIWRSHGYKVVCLTEAENSLSELSLEDVKIFYLPAKKKEFKFYEYPLEERLVFLEGFLKEQHIDAYVYSAVREKEYIYDLLTVKNMGIHFLTDAVEYESMSQRSNTDFNVYKRIIECSDGVMLPLSLDKSKITSKKYSKRSDYEDLFDPSKKEAEAERPIDRIIEDEEFKKACENLAIKRMYKEGNIKIKIKIIVKKILRIFGIKKNMYCDNYNDYLKLKRL